MPKPSPSSRNRRRSKRPDTGSRDAAQHTGNPRRGFPRIVVGAAALLLLAGVLVMWHWNSDGSSSPDDVEPEGFSSSQDSPTDTPPAIPDNELVESLRLPFGGPELWEQIDDPARDGWTVEVMNERVNDAWSTLAKRLADPAPLTAADLQELAVPQATIASLIPDTFETPYEDEVFAVRRASGPAEVVSSANSSTSAEEATSDGPALLAETLNELLEPLRSEHGVLLKAKVVRIVPVPTPEDSEAQRVDTRQLISITARTSAGLVEQHATWNATWQFAAGSEEPRLLTLSLGDWQQASSSRTAPLFADRSAAVLAGNAIYGQQLLRGLNHWYEQLQDTRYMALFGTPGLAMGDVNGDGLEDLYVCQETGLPNRLFLQQADGTAVEAAADWHVDWLDSSRSALLVDLDNDGDQDLAVATVGAVLIAENEGGRFQPRDALRCDDDTMSLCAADYDNDGYLDLYVCVNGPNEELGARRRKIISGMSSAVYFDALNGGRNALFQNRFADQPWKFDDATAATGLSEVNRRVSFAASWEDFDNDGDQDLYVANDFGPNNLYRNDRLDDGSIRFTDVASTVAAEDRAFGMSASWGDYNRDGRMDLYVGNMFSSAGQRVTHQPEFKSEDEQVRAFIQRSARGNTLLANLADGFQDVSDAAEVSVGRWSWSSNFADFNNDGWDDLLVANGYITTEDTGDL